MVYPMTVGVGFGAVAQVTKQPKGLPIAIKPNWLIKPFIMAALTVLFFEVVIVPEDAAQYVGAHPARSRAVHDDGVRLVAAYPRGRDLYAGAGLGERSDHDRGLRTHRGVPARRACRAAGRWSR